MNINRLFYLLLVCISLLSCKENLHTTHVERAYYYWKNATSSLTADELNYIQNDSIEKLYVKFFEVEIDSILGTIPTAKTNLGINFWGFEGKDSIYKNRIEKIQIIPTVYVRNNVLLNTSKGALDTLADNILFLTNKYFTDYYRSITTPFSELQLDCDWTPTTRDNYFYLLKKIKELSGKTISATLRLYPYKYPDKMGVLPVDKAMLMCYNLNNPLSKKTENSILENKVLESYLKDVKKYPIHVDIAFPVFNWVLLYKNNTYSGIIYPQLTTRLKDCLKQIEDNWFVVEKDIFIYENNILLKAGDKLKIEEVSTETLKKSIASIQKYVELSDTTTVTLFHLDEQNLKQYSNETIHSFYTDFTE